MLPLIALTALAAEPVLAPHEAMAHPTAEPVVVEGYLWHVVPYCPPCPEDARCEACLEPFDGVFLAPQRAADEQGVPGIRVDLLERPRNFTSLSDHLVRVRGDLQVAGMARWLTGGTVDDTGRVAETVTVQSGEPVTTPSGVEVRVDSRAIIDPHHKTADVTLSVAGETLSFQADPVRGEWVLGTYRAAVRSVPEGVRVELIPGTPPPIGDGLLAEIVQRQAAWRGLERKHVGVGRGPGLYVATISGESTQATVTVGTRTGRLYD